MGADHDRQFFDTFMIVLGSIVAFTIIIYFLANAIGDRTQGAYVNENPLKAQLTTARLAPVAAVAVEGEAAPAQAMPAAAVAPAPVMPATPTTPPAEMPAATMAAAAAATTSAFDGKTIYASGCVACHQLGVAGAPKLGDAETWAPRIAKGVDALYASSINGIGIMPAKGGRMDLEDDAIRAAVDYMVDAARQ